MYIYSVANSRLHFQIMMKPGESIDNFVFIMIFGLRLKVVHVRRRGFCGHRRVSASEREIGDSKNIV